MPVAVTEYGSGEVLMVGFQNKESLALTLKTRQAYYYYPERDCIEKKGSHSGNIQTIMNIKMNCEENAFLFVVEQKGCVCRTGRHSCFFKEIYDSSYSKQEKFGRLVLDDEK